MRDIKYSTVIAEDEDLIRSGLIRKIEQSGQSFSVIGEATHGEEALELVRRMQPQLLITDIQS